MRNIIVTLLAFLSYDNLISANKPMLNYNIDIALPQTHYAEVTIKIINCESNSLHFKMPVWTPGSYLIREFGKSVEGVQVKADGKPFDINHKDKNTWKAENTKGKTIEFSYKVYAFEPSVRTSFIDADHAFLHNTSIFMYVEEYMNQAGEVQLNFPSDWKKTSTSLNKVSEHTYSFGNYDEFADSPIEIGNHETLEFQIMGVPHEVAMVGLNNCDFKKFTTDLTLACSTMAQIIGEHPCKKYVFIVHNVESGGGGLEHANSCTVMMGRWNWKDEAKYKNFIGLCAHEYFHLWNVKRIRPIELGPFNYAQENYTDLLWVAEGITSYYDELAMFRMQWITAENFAEKLEEYINTLENRPGCRVQSLAESSRDAWIKEYRPNENSKNTTISYYSKGLVVAALLDAEIFSVTQGKKNLDDVMKLLYSKYYLSMKRGFTPEEFANAATQIAGTNMSEFIYKLVYTVQTPDYKSILSRAGVEVDYSDKPENNSGIVTALENNKTIVKQVISESAAWFGGINVNDEIVAVNGAKINNDIQSVIKNIGNPGILTFTVVRSGILREIVFNNILLPTHNYSLVLKSTSSSNLLNIWSVTH